MLAEEAALAPVRQGVMMLLRTSSGPQSGQALSQQQELEKWDQNNEGRMLPISDTWTSTSLLANTPMWSVAGH